MGAGPRPALLLHRTRTDHVCMDAVLQHLRHAGHTSDGIAEVVLTVVTAPLWIPTYVGIVVMRWVMGRDQSNDAR